MSLILRSDLNRRLSVNELDGNFTYLESISGGSSFTLLTTIDYTDLNVGVVSDVEITVVGGKTVNKFITKSLLKVTDPFVSASYSDIASLRINIDNNIGGASTSNVMSINQDSILDVARTYSSVSDTDAQVSDSSDVIIKISDFDYGVNPNNWTNGSAQVWVVLEDMTV